MAQKIQNFIAGKWVDGSGAKLVTCDPATGGLIGEGKNSTNADVKKAIDAASAAYEGWRRIPAPKRGELLYRCAEVIRANKEKYSQLMSREMGKPIKEARGDVQEAIDMGYYIASEGRRAWGWTVPSEMPNKRMYVERVPMGVCSLITPWNFPMAIPSWKTFPALVMGNTVVLKPAQDTPLCAQVFVEALEEAGVPAGVVNLVQGEGAAISDALVLDPRVKMISFTGSTKTGLHLAGKVAPLNKKISLEMGGKNPIIVMPDADLDLAQDAILWAAFGTTGQRCTACSRVILVDPVGDSFVKKLAARASTLRLGPGSDPKTDVAALINEAALKKVAEYVNIGLEQDHAKLVCGGHRATKGALSKGFFFEPTVFDHVKAGMRIEQEEIFGPVLSVIRVKNYEEAVKVANGVSYGLSASIFTGDANTAQRFQNDSESGLCYINMGTTGAEVGVPFGGVKGTGNGHREGGPTVIEAFSDLKCIVTDYSGKVQKAQIDNN